MLGQRPRRWSRIEPTESELLVSVMLWIALGVTKTINCSHSFQLTKERGIAMDADQYIWFSPG